MRSLAENKTVRFFFSFLPCLPFLLKKMLIKWPDCSVTGSLPFKKKSTRKNLNSRSARQYMSIIWNKNCWVLGESNRKLYAVLK